MRSGAAIIAILCLVLACQVATNESRQHSGGLYSFKNVHHGDKAKLVSNYTSAGAAKSDHCSTDYSFDYAQLTLIWPPGSCSTSPHPCEKEQDGHFTIHGMWPTIKGTQKPAFCCFDNTFDYHALDPIMSDLNEYWYSYYGDGSKKFWTHEWLKHGTCARDVAGMRGEANYFGTTLKLAKQLPILESLKKFNIVPDDAKKYSSANILKALEPIGQGKIVQLDCDLEHHQPTPVLTGIAFCYDANLKPADCPPSKPKCQRDLLFKLTSTKSLKKKKQLKKPTDFWY